MYLDRAALAENNLKKIEDELQLVGENMKQLELSAEKAVEREEKLKDKILQIQHKYKAAEGRLIIIFLKRSVSVNCLYNKVGYSRCALGSIISDVMTS